MMPFLSQRGPFRHRDYRHLKAEALNIEFFVIYVASSPGGIKVMYPNIHMCFCLMMTAKNDVRAGIVMLGNGLGQNLEIRATWD
jgi:hypothetical protein